MMSLVRRPAWALATLALALAACGGKGTSRLDERTPGADTGHGVTAFPLVNPTPTPTASPAPTPKPDGGPVTSEEKAVIRGWSDELRAGHVSAASRYFTIPSAVSNAGADALLASRNDVKQFNATLRCGVKLVGTRRSVKHFVIGTFELTERPGASCGSGIGARAEFAFLIRRHHITQWVRVADLPPDPARLPKPPAADAA
jgi:hypothetical protein